MDKKKPSANRSVEATCGSSSRPVTRETCRQMTIREVRQNLQSAFCTLKNRKGVIAPGVLCEIESGGQLLSLFVSTHIDLLIGTSYDFCNAVLNLQSTGININLTSISVIRVDQRMNYTIVELSSQTADECKSHGVHFLKVGTPIAEGKVRFGLKFRI